MSKIEPKYITFEQGKLLDNKGFNDHIRSCPEQWMVVEWLSTKDIILYVEFILCPSNNYRANIITKDKDGLFNNKIILTNNTNETREKAYSAGIDYVLNNLL